MSLTINVYAVSLDRLNKVLGSGDQSTIDAIIADDSDFLSEVDEIDDEAGLPCADAVAELINGRTSNDGLGYLYGYALEAICAHVGETLTTIPGITDSTDWTFELDTLLEKWKAPLSLSALIYDGSPAPIPTPIDYPFIGIWKAASIPAQLAAFDAMDLSGAASEMKEIVSEMRAWLATAAKASDVSLIGFLF